MKDKIKIGLALGAGAARGFAHIGVIKALNENNIPIDMVSGCSMGAFIGALYVTGSDLDMLANLISIYGMNKIRDFSFNNKQGIIKGEKAETLIRLLTKNKTFKETSVPFTCVAVRLRDGKLKVFDKGKIYDAVRASISMQGIFLPKDINGELYVDGAIVERVPVQTVKSMGADMVIGVDVSYRGEDQKSPKNVMQLMQQAMNIMSYEIAKSKMYKADVLILPSVREISPFSNSQVEECVDIGYKRTLDSIDAIKEKIEEIKSNS
ncbi:MAG: patatin-like phospholipase family protein [Eubacteriales bacterium]